MSQSSDNTVLKSLAVFVVGGLLSYIVVQAWRDYVSPAPTPVMIPNPSPANCRLEVLVFSQSGCAPCERLKRTLSDKRIVEQCKSAGIRITHRHDDATGMERYHVKATPTMVQVRPDNGEPVGKTPLVGNQSVKTILDWLVIPKGELSE